MDMEATDLWKTITNEEKYIVKYKVVQSDRLGLTGGNWLTGTSALLIRKQNFTQSVLF